MNLTSLTAADLKHIVTLLEQREALQAQIAEIEGQLVKLGGESAAPATKSSAPAPGRKPSPPGSPGPRKARRAKRGAVKTAILDLVRNAGSQGATVKEIATELGVGYGRISTWFYNTGRNLPSIKKVGEARYAWSAAPAAPAPAAKPAPARPPKAPAKAQPKAKAPVKAKPAGKTAPKPAAKAARPKGKKRGELKQSILELLRAAGKDGISVKEIATKLSMNPKNIYVWFTSTAKRIKEVKQVGPAKYSWAA